MNGRIFWITPGVATAIALAVYGPFGFGRDFGLFVVTTFFILPALVVSAVIFGAWWLLDRSQRGKTVAGSAAVTALLAAVLIPAIWLIGEPLRDPARYAVWQTFHRADLDIGRRQNGVFKHWDFWGLAGMDFNSYLASDHADTLTLPGAADRWATAKKLACPIASVAVWEPGVYLLTTANCPLSDVKF